MLSGALFGPYWGGAVAILGISLGSLGTFMASRYLFSGFVARNFATSITSLNKKVDRHGPVYLLTLRLFPIIPSFVVNLILGQTSFPIRSFVLIGTVGALPGTIAYVLVGSFLIPH